MELESSNAIDWLTICDFADFADFECAAAGVKQEKSLEW